MTQKLFRGTYTAIITPFDEKDRVDYDTLENLLEMQIANGVDGVVVCGTTGESPTLNHFEHSDVIRFVIDRARKRIKVIAGTGSNCTKEAVELSVNAERDEADALLLVSPYYNKPTQEGLYRHFKAVSDAVHIPIILYNIKGRTGVNIETATIMRLAKDCPNILGVKEASGDINQIKEVIAKKPDYFSVLSGDDNLILDLVKSGGDGVISVASNSIPKQVSELTKTCLEGNFEKATKMNEELMPIFKACFIETNPIPIKAMLAMQGLCKEVYRLPLCELRIENRKIVENLLKEKKII
jgi:4-hydroxy-tetrahydrodipicolinate synthase